HFHHRGGDETEQHQPTIALRRRFFGVGIGYGRCWVLRVGHRARPSVAGSRRSVAASYGGRWIGATGLAVSGAGGAARAGPRAVPLAPLPSRGDAPEPRASPTNRRARPRSATAPAPRAAARFRRPSRLRSARIECRSTART